MLKLTYTYDNVENSIEENRFLGEIHFYKYTFKYKYDSNGNWTQKIKFIAGISVFIIEREIAYFKSPSY